MDTFQNHHALFQDSNSISDKLNLFQSLLDSKDLTSDTALALLNIIRPELEKSKTSNASVYRHYTQIMTSLRKQMPDVYEQTISAWQNKQRNTLAIESPLPSPVQEPVKAETTDSAEGEM